MGSSQFSEKRPFPPNTSIRPVFRVPLYEIPFKTSIARMNIVNCTLHVVPDWTTENVSQLMEMVNIEKNPPKRTIIAFPTIREPSSDSTSMRWMKKEIESTVPTEQYKNVYTKKRMKNFVFATPTQLFIHLKEKERIMTYGQWWSILMIQRPHSLQWCARGGLNWLHFTHMLSFSSSVAVDKGVALWGTDPGSPKTQHIWDHWDRKPNNSTQI